MRSGPLAAWPRLLGRANQALTWVGGIAMIVMVGVIVASVVMRYFLGQPMLGTNEVVQMTSVVLVMTALPYCTEQEGHIRVDIFDYALGRWGCLAGDILYRTLSIVVLGALAYRAVLKAADTFKWSDTTNMLNLPVWPSYAVLAAGSALCVLVFVTQILQIIFERPKA